MSSLVVATNLLCVYRDSSCSYWAESDSDSGNDNDNDSNSDSDNGSGIDSDRAQQLASTTKHERWTYHPSVDQVQTKEDLAYTWSTFCLEVVYTWSTPGLHIICHHCSYFNYMIIILKLFHIFYFLHLSLSLHVCYGAIVLFIFILG